MRTLQAIGPFPLVVLGLTVVVVLTAVGHRWRVWYRRTGSGARGWLPAWAAALLGVAVLVTYRTWALTAHPVTLATGFFVVVAISTVVLLLLAAYGADHLDRLPVASGTVVAVVPVYNEEPAVLRETVAALLAAEPPLRRIYVVDDGSKVPVEPFEHPGVVLLRQRNGGKRAAQVNALRRLDPAQVDFLVTVDSDSVVRPDFLTHALRAFSDPRVQGVTSVVTVRTMENLWSRITDLEMVGGIFLIRRARAALGAVTPTSGALAVYRADVVLDNLEDYLASGTFSDDRRLAHYCLLRGKVVALNDVVVDTDMPSTLKGIWRQRLRWYKGYWRYLPWELAHLEGPALGLRVFNTVVVTVYPFALVWILVILPLSGAGLFWQPFALWGALLYAQGVTYAWGRPGMPAGQRVLSWLLLTPLVLLFQVLLVRPAMYAALFSVRSERWDGHRSQGAVITPLPVQAATATANPAPRALPSGSPDRDRGRVAFNRDPQRARHHGSGRLTRTR